MKLFSSRIRTLPPALSATVWLIKVSSALKGVSCVPFVGQRSDFGATVSAHTRSSMSKAIQRSPRTSALLCFMAVVTTGLLSGCGDPGQYALVPPDATSPVTLPGTPPVPGSVPKVTLTSPGVSQISVLQGTLVTATFSADMNAETLSRSSFTVKDSAGVLVPGGVRYDAANRTATFTPAAQLRRGVVYSAVLSSAVTDASGTPLAATGWSFTAAAGPAPVMLGTAGSYVILAKSAVSTTGTTRVTGDLGLSPAARTYFTGFSDTMDATNTFSTSPFVTGRLYAADMAPPTPINLNTAIGDMETAYTDASGRANPTATELAAGELGGLTLAPGFYKWSSAVKASNDVTFNGGPNDTWILQVGQTLNLASSVRVTLAGGAQPKNITWVVAGAVTLGTGSDLEGVVLGKTRIVLQTGAVMHGRALAQTAVTLDASTVTGP